jgi:hypothetical protein
MPEYHFTGKASFTGVDFYIMADSLEQAVALAKRGESHLVEDDHAEMHDVWIDHTSGRLNG